MSTRTNNGFADAGFATGAIFAGGRAGASGCIAFGGFDQSAGTIGSESGGGAFVTCLDGDTSEGGDLDIMAGSGPPTGGFAGSVKGGSVNLEAGNGTGVNASGGTMSIRGGNGSGNGGATGGDISLIAGQSQNTTTGNAGDISLFAGGSSSSDAASNGGNATLRSGNSSQGNAGTAEIQGGTAANGVAGSVRLTPGTGSTNGEIELNGQLSNVTPGIRFSAVNGFSGASGTTFTINFTPALPNVPRCVQLTGDVAAGPTAFNVTSRTVNNVDFTASQIMAVGDVVFLLAIT